MTDLQPRIAAAIARVTASRAAAEVVREIETTHVMIKKAELRHTYNVLMAAGKTREASRLQSVWGDLDPIRHDAAKSDTSELPS